jgi:hypothetical protein
MIRGNLLPTGASLPAHEPFGEVDVQATWEVNGTFVEGGAGALTWAARIYPVEESGEGLLSAGDGDSVVLVNRKHPGPAHAWIYLSSPGEEQVEVAEIVLLPGATRSGATVLAQEEDEQHYYRLSSPDWLPDVEP